MNKFNMIQRFIAKSLAIAGMVASFTLLLITSSWANGNGNNPRVIPPHAHAFGKTYGQWSAEWWKWHLHLPATGHPAYSLDGANCGAGQKGKVWFLIGAFTTEFPQNAFNTIVRESCVVPTGKAIFFPIINVECSTIEADPYHLVLTGDNYDNRDDCAAKFVKGTAGDGTEAVVKDLTVSIDGKSLKNLYAYRAKSPVFGFQFNDPIDNILDVDCSLVKCDNAQAVSDGYWIMLPPQSAGKHKIRFTGSFRNPVSNALFFGLDVTYQLKIVGGKK